MKRIPLDELTNKIFSSTNYGDFIILGEAEKTSKHRRVIIRFLETDSELSVGLYEALNGNVKDPNASKKLNITPNEIFESNGYGKFIIIKDYGFLKDFIRVVRIKFLETGYETDISYNAVKAGNVKDIMLPTVYNVGYMGTKDNLNTQYFSKILYHRWINMLARCYCENSNNYQQYGAKGIKVSDDWHCFDNYRNDVKQIYGYHLFMLNPKAYQIDKDYLQSNKDKKYYSKNTCIWLNATSNILLSSLKPTNSLFIYKSGDFYYTIIFEPNDCSLVQYGPFIIENEAKEILNSINIHHSIRKKISI